MPNVILKFPWEMIIAILESLIHLCHSLLEALEEFSLATGMLVTNGCW